MADLKNIVYLSNEDYETLVTTGTVTIGGDTLTYDETNNVYVTPEETASSTNDGLMSAADKVKLDGIAPGAGVDTNQTVKVGSTTFGANDAVSFTGTGAASVTANATTKTINIDVSGASASHVHPFTPAGSVTLTNTGSTGTTYVESITSNAATGTPTTKGLHKGTTTVLTGVKASGTANAAPHTHTHTVTVSGTTGANSGTAVTAITGVGATGTASVNTDAIKNVTLSASTTATDGPAYVSAISGGSAVSPTVKYMKFTAGTIPKSGATPNHESTATGSNDASETVNKSDHTHPVTLTAYAQDYTGRQRYLYNLSGEAPSLTGTTTFNTNAIKNANLSASDTNTDGPAYISSISGGSAVSPTTKYMKFNAGTTPPSSATFSGSKTNSLVTAVSVNSQGSVTLSGSRSASGSGTSARRTLTITGSHSGTTLTVTKGDYTPAGTISFTAGTAPSMNFNTGTSTDTPYISTISGGSAVSATTKYMKLETTDADTGTVSISGGSYTAGVRYLAVTTGASTSTVTVAKDTHTHNYDKTTSISLTNGTAPSMNFDTGVTTDTPYVSAVSGGSAVSATTRYMKVKGVAASTTTVITGVEATDTASVAPNNHTHSYGSSTALTTSNNSGSAVKAVTGVAADGTASAITSLTVNATPATGDITYLESYTVSGGGASATTKHLNATFNGDSGTTDTPQ